MTKKNLVLSAALCTILAPGSLMFGQQPVQNIDSQKHPYLASAQTSIAHAVQKIDSAQQAHQNQLGDHAQKAKDLLIRASQELKEAAEFSNQHQK